MYKRFYNSCKFNSIYFKVVLVLLVLILGVLFRIFPVQNFVKINPNNLENQHQLFLKEDKLPIFINTMILDFYNNLDKGNYDGAFNSAIELVWEKDIYFDKNKNIENNKVVGTKRTQDLINRAVKELGENGEKLSIYDTKVLSVMKVNLNKDYNKLQDVEIIKKVLAIKKVDSIYIASVEGEIYSSFCSHSKWHKDLVLIKFKDENDIKVFLSGAKNIIGNSSIEWFVNRVVGEYIKI